MGGRRYFRDLLVPQFLDVTFGGSFLSEFTVILLLQDQNSILNSTSLCFGQHCSNDIGLLLEQREKILRDFSGEEQTIIRFWNTSPKYTGRTLKNWPLFQVESISISAIRGQ